MIIANILKEYKQKSFEIFLISLIILTIFPLVFYLIITSFSGFGFIIINSKIILIFEKLCFTNLLIGFLIPTSIIILSFICGLNRYFISKIFPYLTFFTIYGLIAYITLFAINFSFIFFCFINEIAGLRLFYVIVLIVSFVTFLKILPPIIIGIFNFAKTKRISRIAYILKKESQKNIFSLVQKVAQKIDAKKPDNIVVGLTTDFFASNMKMKIFDGNTEIYIEGETLYISLPYLRVLTIQEFESIIGHELAHFSGEDTVYSILFSPIRIRLNEQFYAFENFLRENKRAIEKTIISIPIYPIIFLFNEFSRKDERIRKQRELIADETGSKAAGSDKTMINALCKLVLYDLFWYDFEKQYYEEISTGTKKIDNLSLNFINIVKKDLDYEKIEVVLDEILKAELKHPGDTHPSIEQRMANLNVSKQEITKESLTNFIPSAATLINDIDIIEKNMTLLLNEMVKYHNR